ncbi:hypothetical protein DENSPDRAFT_787858, partial [Dentipellis sp. KUC8613]
NMAHLFRPRKPGNEWTENDLKSYNIHFQIQDATTFFGTPESEFPQTPLASSPEGREFMHADAEAPHDIATASDANAALLTLLNLASAPRDDSESATNDFVVELFKRIGYTSRRRVARTRQTLSFLVGGGRTSAMADVVLCQIPGRAAGTRHETQLVVQEIKTFQREFHPDPRPVLVAGAIAAVWEMYEECGAGTPLVDQVMPGIIMAGTTPIFVKVPVSAELALAVCQGTYPAQPTTVAMFTPVVDGCLLRGQGMQAVENRERFLRCFEAFKAVIGI